MGVVRIWSRVKVKFWSRSRVKADNWESKFLTPVTGGSIESMQPISPCVFYMVLLASRLATVSNECTWVRFPVEYLLPDS